MWEIVLDKPKPQVFELNETNYPYSTIYVCQWGKNNLYQNILVERRNKFLWESFYIGDKKRTEYSSIKCAIKSRLERGYQVYMLNNKKEFKEFINFKEKE